LTKKVSNKRKRLFLIVGRVFLAPSLFFLIFFLILKTAGEYLAFSFAFFALAFLFHINKNKFRRSYYYNNKKYYYGLFKLFYLPLFLGIIFLVLSVLKLVSF
jgi:hypothetical protein